MAKRCIIGIDVGTSGVKVLAIDEQAAILASVIEEYPLYTPQAGWTEQDPEDWWQATASCLRQVTARLAGYEIAVIGLSGQMHGMVALDKDDRVVRRAILWNDQRTGKQCEEITAAAGGLDGLLSYTNNQMLTGFTGGKILWMKQNEPDNYAKTVRIINPKDYIRFRLSGTLMTDVSDASGTGFFDVRTRSWSTALLAKLDIDAALFAPVVESTAAAGQVNAAAAAETGLPVDTLISGGGGDAVISTTGLGLIKPGRIGVTLGTSGVVAMGLPGFMENPGGKLQISCNNAPGTWHAMGVTLAAAGSYHWFRNTFARYERERAQVEGKSAFYLLDQAAKVTDPGADGLLFLPYLTGERCPVNDPDARGAFLGITSIHELGHFARAVMEGVAFSLRQVYDLIIHVNPDLVEQGEVILAGGGAVSPVWRQIFADVFNLPVRTVYGSAEGGSFGAALVAGVTAGIWSSLAETVPLIKPESETTPRAEYVPVYEQAYAKYVKMYDALKWSF